MFADDQTQRNAQRFLDAHVLEMQNTINDLLKPGHLAAEKSREFFSIPQEELRERFNGFVDALQELTDFGQPHKDYPKKELIRDGLNIVTGMYKMYVNVKGMVAKKVAGTADKKSHADLQSQERDVARWTEAVTTLIKIAKGVGMENAQDYAVGLDLINR